MRDADVTVRVVAGRTPVATVFSGPLAAGANNTFSWAGTGGDGRPVADGRYRTVVTATTTLGTRTLMRDVVVDTTPPRLSYLRAFRYGGGLTLSRFVLSEKARVTLALRRTVVTVWRARGRRSVSIPATAAYVRTFARDRAGNVGRTTRAAVRTR